MGRLLALLVCIGLFACQKAPAPVAPVESVAPGIAWDPVTHQEMVTWFAGRGITLPSEPPAKAVAKPAANDQKILGDATGDGEVDYWDISPLWLVLSGAVWPYGGVDWDLLDIDRDGDRDWNDLQYLGEHIFSSSLSPPNPYRIGEPLGGDPATSYNIDLVFVDGHGFSASQMALFEEAAERWEAIITDDVRNSTYFIRNPWDSSEEDWWGKDAFGPVVVDDEVDDLRVFVASSTPDDFWGRARGVWHRGDNRLPLVAMVAISEAVLASRHERNGVLRSVMLHELGHALGFNGGRGVGRQVSALEFLQGEPRSRHLLFWMAHTDDLQPRVARTVLQRAQDARRKRGRLQPRPQRYGHKQQRRPLAGVRVRL